MNAVQNTFEGVYRISDDPWAFRTSWYEARKRAILLSCLPRQRYHSAYEPGCSNGELAAALALRCDRLRVSDGVPAAVALARTRLSSFTHVEVAHEWVPQDWGTGVYDLIVIGEMGFYLSADALTGVLGRVKHSLAAEGTVVACHWRHPVKGYTLDGDTVHQMLETQLGIPRVVHHQEADFVLDVWSADGQSVAQHEGLHEEL